jgi:hypothetical protein
MPKLRDTSAHDTMLTIQRRLKRKREASPSGKFYVRLSLERWRPLRRAMAGWLGLEPHKAREAEDQDLMPWEYPDGGVIVYGLPVAIQKSRASKRLYASGCKPITVL